MKTTKRLFAMIVSVALNVQGVAYYMETPLPPSTIKEPLDIYWRPHWYKETSV